jgi:hypothetical protein
VIARIVPQIIGTGHAEELGFGIEVDPAQRGERRLGLKGVLVIGVVKGPLCGKSACGHVVAVRTLA